MIRVNNRDFEWFEGLTVKKMLELKRYTFPEIVVKINGVYIPPEDYEITPINDGDEVLALHMFGGGWTKIKFRTKAFNFVETKITYYYRNIVF